MRASARPSSAQMCQAPASSILVHHPTVTQRMCNQARNDVGLIVAGEAEEQVGGRRVRLPEDRRSRAVTVKETHVHLLPQPFDDPRITLDDDDIMPALCEHPSGENRQAAAPNEDETHIFIPPAFDFFVFRGRVAPAAGRRQFIPEGLTAASLRPTPQPRATRPLGRKAKKIARVGYIFVFGRTQAIRRPAW